WVFTTEGAWVASGSGAGDGVWIERHDGVITSMHSEWGRSVDLFYAQGRLAKAVASDGRSVSYAYDSQGRLVEVTTRPDGVHHYQWDGWLLSQVIDASGVAQCVNTFDALGRIRTQRDATGHLTRFTYLPGGVTVADDGQ
ncbi:RHS repeat protein, partial [Xanthomonas citri pv. citri]|nr:RHS repeat protein [Xanthomonas citri pv. citri]